MGFEILRPISDFWPPWIVPNARLEMKGGRTRVWPFALDTKRQFEQGRWNISGKKGGLSLAPNQKKSSESHDRCQVYDACTPSRNVISLITTILPQ